MEVEQLELDLWQSLETATQFPGSANLRFLCDALEQTIQHQSTTAQLQVAAEVFVQLSEVHAARVNLMLDSWEYRHDPKEPIVNLDDCVDLFVQSLHLNIDDLLAEPEPIQYPANRRSRTQPGESVAGLLDKDQLLAALDQQIEQHPGMTEAEAFNQATSIAHDEDISTWAAAIAAYLHQRPEPAVPLLQLLENVTYPMDKSTHGHGGSLVKTWLTLLLGGFSLEQRGDFYGTEIWIKTLST